MAYAPLALALRDIAVPQTPRQQGPFVSRFLAAHDGRRASATPSAKSRATSPAAAANSPTTPSARSSAAFSRRIALVNRFPIHDRIQEINRQ